MVIYTGNPSAVLKLQRLPSSPVPPAQGLLCQWFCFARCWAGLSLLHEGFTSRSITPEHGGSACRAIQCCSPCTLLSSTSSQLCWSWISMRSSHLQREITAKQAPSSLCTPPVPIPHSHLCALHHSIETKTYHCSLQVKTMVWICTKGKHRKTAPQGLKAH